MASMTWPVRSSTLARFFFGIAFSGARRRSSGDSFRNAQSPPVPHRPQKPRKEFSPMQINKVLIKQEKIHLEYSKRIPKATGEFLVDDYSMTCSEPAVPGFYDTL